MLHTGDLTHLSKPAEFDTLQQVLSDLSMPVFYVPGEHDVLEDDGKSYLQRFGKGTQGDGWHSFDQHGVHFIGLVNVVNLKAGGLGSLGTEQLEWLEKDVKHLKSSTPIVVFAHIPLWSVYPEWGWGTDDSAQALSYLKRFGSVSVLNGHIHQVMQKVEGHVTFHTAMSTAFPQPAPGSAPSPGPMKVEADRLKKVLGLSRMSFQTSIIRSRSRTCRSRTRPARRHTPWTKRPHRETEQRRTNRACTRRCATDPHSGSRSEKDRRKHKPPVKLVCVSDGLFVACGAGCAGPLSRAAHGLSPFLRSSCDPVASVISCRRADCCCDSPPADLAPAEMLSHYDVRSMPV